MATPCPNLIVTHYNPSQIVPFHLSGVPVCESKVQSENQGQDTDDQYDDPEQPPFQPASALSVLDTFVELYVSGLGVVLDVLGVLLGLLDHGFLDDNGLGKVLEELVELHQGAFDALNVVVTGTNGAENSRGGRCAVGLELNGG